MELWCGDVRDLHCRYVEMKSIILKGKLKPLFLWLNVEMLAAGRLTSIFATYFRFQYKPSYKQPAHKKKTREIREKRNILKEKQVVKSQRFSQTNIMYPYTAPVHSLRHLITFAYVQTNYTSSDLQICLK